MRHACSTPNICTRREDVSNAHIEVVDTRPIPPIIKSHFKDCSHYQFRLVDGKPICEKVPWTTNGLVCLALCVLVGTEAYCARLGCSV